MTKRLWIRLGLAAAMLPGLSPSPAWGQVPAAPEPPAAGDPVVHSWALAPATADRTGTGARPNLSYQAAPGSEVRDEVTVFNYSNVTMTYRLYATDAFNSDDGSFSLLSAQERPSGVGTWVSLPQSSVTLLPRSQATMPVVLKVPVTARPGDHAGAILASSQALGTGPDGKTITLDRRTGSRLYVRVDGPLAPELAVEQLRTTYGAKLNPLGGTAEVSYRIENRGNVRMAGKHRVAVAGPFGLLERAKEPAEIPELLPGEGVTVRVTFDGVAALGLATARVHLEPLAVGTAEMAVDRVSRRAAATALPYSVLAFAMVAGLVAVARRSYLGHRVEASPSMM